MAIEVSDLSKGRVITRPAHLNNMVFRSSLGQNIAKLANDLKMIGVESAIQYSTDEFCAAFIVKQPTEKEINKRLDYIKTQCRLQYSVKARGVLDNGKIIIWKHNV